MNEILLGASSKFPRGISKNPILQEFNNEKLKGNILLFFWSHYKKEFVRIKYKNVSPNLLEKLRSVRMKQKSASSNLLGN